MRNPNKRIKQRPDGRQSQKDNDIGSGIPIHSRSLFPYVILLNWVFCGSPELHFAYSEKVSSFSIQSFTGVSVYSVSEVRQTTFLIPALMMSLRHMEQGVVPVR